MDSEGVYVNASTSGRVEELGQKILIVDHIRIF
jgi:hypothetical protein